jgi:hypothetical protein
LGQVRLVQCCWHSTWHVDVHVDAPCCAQATASAAPSSKHACHMVLHGSAALAPTAVEYNQPTSA